MRLETTLFDITGRLRQRRFPNDRANVQAIGLRVLEELVWNTGIAWPGESKEKSRPGIEKVLIAFGPITQS
jgi:hypothetical protein